MEIITKEEAIEQGLKRYFTGKPCKYGHVSERYVSVRRCCECSKERKDYNRLYYERNRDEILKKMEEHYKNNKEKISERSAKYYKNNKEKFAERGVEYRKANKEKISEYGVKYYKNNKEKVAGYVAKYRKANKEKVAESSAKYQKNNPLPYFIRRSLARMQTNWKGGRAKEEQALGYTYEQLQQRIECQFKDGMNWDNRSEWHIDHKKPVSRFINQGITDPAIINALSNLQPLWAKDNLSKGAKYND